ncbi:glycosyltransferase family 4 protein [Polaromonas sp. DSR2-3-2]|uniref:glycosyltransferase family 4 protein n=1 Tax=unclassified Polaromonas TaxID=2638319 RepID=UPI003CF87743
MSDNVLQKKQTVLLEMRPAMDGFAGIPQETRLLFKGLCLLNNVEVEGLLQTSLRFLPHGMRTRRNAGQGADTVLESDRMNCYSRFILSLENKPSKKLIDVVSLYFKRREEVFKQTFKTLLMPKKRIGTTVFEPKFFESVVWQTLFSKTLAAADFALVTSRNFRICTVPWNIMQSVGLASLKFGARVRTPRYPRLDTRGVDVFIAQTPYPARVDIQTALVVRYHDALPVFMSHAFANKHRHQATHFNALQANVRDGAYFACVSESTRQDLLKIFPDLGTRAVTIHNMVSPHFFMEPSLATRVPQIVRSRINTQSPLSRPNFKSLTEQESFYDRHLGQGTEPLRYLLMVSTIEPRKNHTQLIAAWEAVRAVEDPSLKLVLVGSMGWDVEPIMREMRSLIDQGQLYVLSGVPAADLRVLYRHAAATVCPSLAEGFDFSGVESMCSGGIAIASDIAVHREVYAHAAEYFDPYAPESLVGAIKRVLYDPCAPKVQEEMRALGKEVSLRYLPAAILPQWEKFLNRIAGDEEVVVNPSPLIKK